MRLHDPATGTSQNIANIPVYTHSEDGLYGPAVDRDFANNKWVYLFYSPLRMEGNDLAGNPYPKQTPQGAASTVPQPSMGAWADWKGYFQLSRFKFVDGPNAVAGPRLRAEDHEGRDRSRGVLPRRG